ncbi:hypothetical protein COO60DRAFT_1481158 [Scenedesmus sp. NREL 46B-D3]|nr:hypothetical protein COO60DRAFT_1481158 [Scenedesmus sp. NREL 46B-D3]
MQSRIRSGAEASTSCFSHFNCNGLPRRLVPSRISKRSVIVVRPAVSDEDRSGDQTYQKASSVPDLVPVVEPGTDWREFRARLVANSRSASTAAAEPASSSSSTAPEGAWATTRSSFNQLEWAHELSQPEAGCLLLAHPYMFREKQTYFYQAVILLLDHGPEGSYGIILNRPTQYKVSQIKSTVHELLSLFSDNKLFMGGDCGDTAMVVLTHRADIEGVTQVTEGVYHHNVHGAAAAVAAGKADPSDFRFFAQYAGWAPGQLEEECKAGVWFCTAASPALTLNAELNNGRSMWHAVLQVMNGDHARVSDIVSEVERRDLRAATARLQQQQQQQQPLEQDTQEAEHEQQ